MTSIFSPGIFWLFLGIMVVVSHTTRLALGTWAVYVFFMLSGYWIARMYANQYVRAANPYQTFVISRLWRILPTYLLCLAFTVLVLAALGAKSDWSPMAASFDSPIFLLRNAALFTLADMDYKFIMPAWSLDIELQFYLVAPLFMILAGLRTKTAFYCVVAGLAGLSMFQLAVEDATRYVSVFQYFGFFLAGMSMHIFDWRPSRTTALAVVLLLVLALGAIVAEPEWRGVLLAGKNPDAAYAFNHRFSALLALAVAPYIAWCVRNPSSRLDRHFGNVTYIVYLVLWAFTVVLAGQYGHLPAVERLPYFVATWVATGLVSVAIYRFFDMPVDRRRAAFVRRRIAPVGGQRRPTVLVGAMAEGH